MVSQEENELPLSKELIANHVFAPSYVSMQTALRHYGFIPKSVYVTQSMTVKPSLDFDTPLGHFGYTHIAREAFGIGLRIEQTPHAAFTIATPEKALCDLIANTFGLTLRYIKDVERYLEEDIRFDVDAIQNFDVQLLSDYTSVGKKADSIKALIKFL